MKHLSEKGKPLLKKDIPYLGGEQADAPAMDAWLPWDREEEENRKLPAIVLIHGGGWTTGDKADEREKNMAADLCALGYAVFSINYHMAVYEQAPYRGKRIVSAWPECMTNSMDAVSYIRANARQFHVEPERICVIGSSAGGHLALLLATAWESQLLQKSRRYPEVSCRIAGAVSCYGVPDITAWGGELLMPEPYDKMTKEWHLASPAEQMQWTHPPIMLIHGDKDDTVLVEHSVSFYKLLCRHGHRAQLMVVRDGKHSFDFRELSPLQMKELNDFLLFCFREEKSL